MNRHPNPKYVSDKRRGRPERRITPMKHIVVNRENLAWAAGFFDGEGCFSSCLRYDDNTKKKYIASIGQVDRKGLERFQEAVQLGKIYGPYGPYGNRFKNARPFYRLDIYGFEQSQALLALLWTWLGPVKRQQARSVLYPRSVSNGVSSLAV